MKPWEVDWSAEAARSEEAKPWEVDWSQPEAPPPEGGFMSSVKQTAGSVIKGAGQAAADFIPGVGQDNAVKRYGQEVIDANPTAVRSLRDIADKPGTAVAEAAGNAGASIGGMVGARALGMGITAAAPLTGPLAPATALVGQAVAWLGPAAIAALPSFGGIRDKQIFNDPAMQDDWRAKTAATLGAAAVGAIESKFGPQNWALSAMTKEGRAALAEKFAETTLAKGVGYGALKGAAVEGAEELVQNPIEQVASFENPTTRENLEDTAFSGAMGAIGGGVFGGAAGALSPRQKAQQPKEEPAAPTLGLPYNPDPFVSFPDGTVGRREDVERYIAGLPEDQRVAARAKLAGLAPQKADPVESILSAPDADAAIRNFVDGVQTSIAGTGADALLAPANDFLGAVRGREADVAADAADLADFRASEERNLQVARAQAQQAQQRQAELDALQATGTGQYGIPIEAKPAVEQAATLEAPTAMQVAMQRAREKAAQGQGATPLAQPLLRPETRMDAGVEAESVRAAATPLAPEAQPLAPARSPDILPADITRNDGQPFQTESGARLKQRYSGGIAGSDVVPVQGGFVVRPKPLPSTPDASTQPQATATPATPDAGAAALPAAPEVQPAGGGADLAAGNAQPGDGALKPVDQRLVPVSKRTPAAQALAGPKIDAEWTAFAPESGTRGVPRADMPQIKAEARGALTQFLGARGITHESVEVAASDLKPTQAEFSPAKVAKAKAYEGGERSILVGSDGHILDGHHQWAAALEDGKPVKAIRLDAPIEKLLAEVKEFPSAQAAAGATKPKDQRLVPVSKRGKPAGQGMSEGAESSPAPAAAQGQAQTPAPTGQVAEGVASSASPDATPEVAAEPAPEPEAATPPAAEQTRAEPDPKISAIAAIKASDMPMADKVRLASDIERGNVTPQAVAQMIEQQEPAPVEPPAAAPEPAAKPAPKRKGIPRKRLDAFVESIGKDGPKDVRIADTVDDLPESGQRRIKSEGMEGVRGMYDRGTDTVWLVRENLGSEAEAQFVLLHEAFHRGLVPVLGDGVKPVLNRIYLTNKSVREQADRLAKELKIGRMEAIEEVLADMAGEGKARDLTGWDRLVALIRQFVEKLGFDLTFTDDMVEDLVAAVRREGLKGGVHINTPTSQTETPEFKRWFGDSVVRQPMTSSKQRFEDMKPLVVYHGTSAQNLVEFQPSRDGNVATTLGGNSTVRRQGVFLAENPEFAATFAEQDGGRDANVMPVYARIENPLYLDAGFKPETLEKLLAAGLPRDTADDLRRLGALQTWQAFDGDAGGKLVKAAQAAGFDGALIEEEGVGLGDSADSQQVWVAFRPEQIKSAIGNRGTFDPGNPDIRFNAGRDTTAAVANQQDVAGNQGGTPAGDSTEGAAPSLRELMSQEPDGHLRLFHNGDAGVSEIYDGGAFGGLFATSNPSTAVGLGRKPSMYFMDVPREKILDSHTLEYELDYDLVRKALLDSVYPLRNADESEFEQVWKAVIEDKDGDEDVLMAMFGASEPGEASWEAQRVRGEVARRLGYQAVEMSDEHGTSYLVLPGVKVYSANESSAPDGGGAMFSRSLLTGRALPQAWQAPDPSRLDNLIYSLQDKQIDTKRVVKAVRDAIGGLADNLDPYLQEELYHGRAAKATKDFLDGSLRPLMVDLQARGVEISDFEEYLHNRHAERRNVQVAKVNPAMPDGGSGIKTADARAYLAGLPVGKRRAYEALAKRVDQINRDTRALLVSSGLEKQETIDAWDAAYGDEYVPLMREEMDGGVMGIGQGFSVRGGSSKRAMGSDKPVADILANIALQREKAITRAEKRRIGEALYGMVLSAPNDDFWFAVDPALQQNPSQITATAMQLISMGLNPADAQSIAAEPTQRYIDPRTNQVAERINPALRSADNVLAVRIDGEDKYVFFNAKDERAMRMVRSLKNLDADQLGEVMGTVSKMTRYFSAVNTQWNPIFGVVNVTRDIQTALLNLQSTPLKGMQREVAKHIGPALRGIYIDLRDRRAGKPTTSAYAQLWEEFQNEGGATGYRDMYANAKERAEAIADELKAIKDGTLKKTGKGILNWLSDYNESMENAVRVAAYKVGKEQGLSNQQAASIAKNLATNFSRKGQVALQAGALYAFFNASIQGTARIAQTMFEGGKLSGLGKRILTGGLMLGSMQAMLLAAAGFDDDEPPDFVRERSLVLPIGGDKYISIPMPLGFHVIPNLARIPTEWALGGFKDTPKRLGQLVGLFADAFNPIGSAGLSLQTLTPTIIDPLAALTENRDFTGKPIAKQDFSSMQPTAGHTRAKDTATPWAKAISYATNWLTGGTDYKPGLVSPTPDQIDYLIGQATGGVGREAAKLAQVGESTLTGEELPLYKIPLVGRFVGTTAGQAAESARFYGNIKEIGQHDAELTGLRADRRQAEAAEYLQDNPQARMVKMADRTYREVRKLIKAKRDAVEAGASKDRIKLLDQQITARMAAFNARVKATEAREPALQ